MKIISIFTLIFLFSCGQNIKILEPKGEAHQEVDDQAVVKKDQTESDDGVIVHISSDVEKKSIDQKKTKVLAEEKKKPEQISITEPKETKPYFSKRVAARYHTRAMIDFCRKIDKKFLHWGWGEAQCRQYRWHHVRDSVKGDPLMWAVFGDEKNTNLEKQNVTMILCGVHGDEITPIKFCWDTLKYLNDNFNSAPFKDSLVVVAPIANPDSFFIKKPTRTNANGVDINRNFPTKDWDQDAIRLWKSRYSRDKRRYPGERALSEPETVFQVNLIKRYHPKKIISIHAPLTILDYDGPETVGKGENQTDHLGNQLLIQMSKEASGYRIKNYPFFPGSLGNYAGNERNIPTYTLELPTSDNRKHKEYWRLFEKAIHTAITKQMKDGPVAQAE